MTRTIHQLYCTHCTYGTSALHRNTGNVRTQVFEYSTRKGSIEQSLSHQTFQRFEKQFFRGVPMAGDAPIDVRRRDAETAPWRRMVYSHSVDGLRMLANVCYRTTDTSGRLGSYFAHVLIEEEKDGQGCWNPAECLKLWGATFWRTADEELSESIDDSYVLKPVATLSCDGYGSIVNDDVLTEFLTAKEVPPTYRSVDAGIPQSLDSFPERWRKIPTAERVQLLKNLLHAVLKLDVSRQERLVIAVEPAVAALLFYGIFRLLPEIDAVQRLSFSTFESHFERSVTVMTAHDFADPRATDLQPETYRGRGFTVNTYSKRPPSAYENPNCQYAEMMVQSFVQDGVTATDQLRAQLTAMSDVTCDQLESLALVRRNALRILTAGESTGSVFANLSKVEKQFASRILASQVATASDDAIKSFASSPAFVSTLEIVASAASDPTAKQAVKRLVTVLPSKAQKAFFGMPKLPSEWKVAWLNSYLKRKGQFPQNCPSLWFDDSLQPSRVLADLFLQSTAEQISSWYASVPKECIWSFASALGIAAQRDPVKRSLLVSTIERMDDGGLCNLLDKPSGRADAILGNIDDGDSRFIARMNRFDDGIRTAAPDQVGPRVEVLLSNESHLRFLRVSLKKWKDVHEAIKRCNQCLADPSGRMAPDLKRALCEVLRAFGNALSDSERSVAAIEIDSKHVEPMLRRWLNSQRPDLLEQSIRALTALQLEATDDQSLCAFLAGKNGTAWRRGLAPGDTSLQERVQRILEELPETVSRFSEEGNEFPDGDNTLSTNGEALRVRLAGLEASREWLGAGKSHLRSWQQLMEHLGWIKDFVANAGDPNDPKARLASADLAPYVVTTIGAQLKYDPSQKAGMRLTAKRCLRNLSLAAVGYDTLIKWPIVVRAIEMEFEKRAAAKGGGFFSVFKG